MDSFSRPQETTYVETLTRMSIQTDLESVTNRKRDPNTNTKCVCRGGGGCEGKRGKL